MKPGILLLALVMSICLAAGAGAQNIPKGGGPPIDYDPGAKGPSTQGGGTGTTSSSSSSASSSGQSSSTSSSGGGQSAGGPNPAPPPSSGHNNPPNKSPDAKTPPAKPNVPHDDKNCDLVCVVAGKFCLLEGKVLDREDLTRNAEKEEVCKSCLTRPEEVLVCIKKLWTCNFGHKLVRREQPRGPCGEYNCGGTGWKLAEESRCVVLYKCDGCETWWLKDRTCDTPGCKKKGLRARKTCSRSGERPHVHEQ